MTATALTDGKVYVVLYMGYCIEGQYTPSISDDFFKVVDLPLDEYGFHIVDDVYSCCSQMYDWHAGRGDYCGDMDTDIDFDCRVIFDYDIDKEDLTA